MKCRRNIVLAGIGLILVSCRPESEKTESRAENPQAVALVGESAISAEALRVALERQGPRDLADSSLEREKKLAVLETLVRGEAVYAKARLAGFEQRPDIQARIKSLIIERFREEQFKPYQGEPSATEIQAYYQAHNDQFQQNGAVRGGVIFLKCSATATAEKKAELRSEAETVLKEAMKADKSSFAALVTRRSDDQSTRYRGGDTGWQGSEDKLYDFRLIEALIALQTPGEFAQVIETGQGFFVARLIEKRERGLKPLAEVKELIRYQLAREKAVQAEQEFYSAMKAGLEIRTNLALVDTVSLPVPMARAAMPSVPGGQLR